MATVSATILPRARKNETVILSALARVGQIHVSTALGVHESTISRAKSEGELDRIARLLAAMGLKVVPETYRCYPEEQIQAVLTLAKARLDAVSTAAELAWED